MKKYLSLVLAVLMVLTSTAFAAPAIDAGIEDFEEAAPVVEEAVAEVQAVVTLPSAAELGTLIFEADFEEYGIIGGSTTPLVVDGHSLASVARHYNKECDFGKIDGSIVTGYKTFNCYGYPSGTKQLISDPTLTNCIQFTGASDTIFGVMFNSPLTNEGVYTFTYDMYDSNTTKATNIKYALGSDDSTTACVEKAIDVTTTTTSNGFTTYMIQIPLNSSTSYSQLQQFCAYVVPKAANTVHIDNLRVYYKAPSVTLSDMEDNSQEVNLTGENYTLPTTFNGNAVSQWVATGVSYDAGQSVASASLVGKKLIAIYEDDADKGKLLYYFDFETLDDVGTNLMTSSYSAAYVDSSVTSTTNQASLGSLKHWRKVVPFDGDGAFTSFENTASDSTTFANQTGITVSSSAKLTKLGTYTAEYDLYIPGDVVVKHYSSGNEKDYLRLTGFVEGTSSNSIGYDNNVALSDIERDAWNKITSVGVTSSVAGAKNAVIGGVMFVNAETNVSEFYADNLRIWFTPATVKFGAAEAQDLNDFTTNYAVPAVTTPGNVWVSTDYTVVLEGGASVAYADYTAKLQDKEFVEISEDDAAARIITSDLVSKYAMDDTKGMTTNGVRFEATISAAAHDAVEEYGFQVSATADFTEKLTQVVGTAVDGEWNETVYSVDDETGDVTFSVVCYGMEESATLYVRPYIKANGAYDYGETVSASYVDAE